MDLLGKPVLKDDKEKNEKSIKNTPIFKILPEESVQTTLGIL
jgi:hypothetical protein